MRLDGGESAATRIREEERGKEECATSSPRDGCSYQGQTFDLALKVDEITTVEMKGEKFKKITAKIDD